VEVPSNGAAPMEAPEDRMHDLGWLAVILALFLLARALVRLCERLM
jgi:hypothetical protein